MMSKYPPPVITTVSATDTTTVANTSRVFYASGDGAGGATTPFGGAGGGGGGSGRVMPRDTVFIPLVNGIPFLQAGADGHIPAFRSEDECRAEFPSHEIGKFRLTARILPAEVRQQQAIKKLGRYVMGEHENFDDAERFIQSCIEEGLAYDRIEMYLHALLTLNEVESNNSVIRTNIEALLAIVNKEQRES